MIRTYCNTDLTDIYNDGYIISHETGITSSSTITTGTDLGIESEILFIDTTYLTPSHVGPLKLSMSFTDAVSSSDSIILKLPRNNFGSGTNNNNGF